MSRLLDIPSYVHNYLSSTPGYFRDIYIPEGISSPKSESATRSGKQIDL